MSRFPAHKRRIVETIAGARKTAKVSGRALSRKLNQDHTYISKIERMQRGVSGEEIAAIARALGLDPGEFYKKTRP